MLFSFPPNNALCLSKVLATECGMNKSKSDAREIALPRAPLVLLGAEERQNSTPPARFMRTSVLYTPFTETHVEWVQLKMSFKVCTDEVKSAANCAAPSLQGEMHNTNYNFQRMLKE